MDQEHSKFVLTTGFHRFWRGYSQKERMYLISHCFHNYDSTPLLSGNSSWAVGFSIEMTRYGFDLFFTRISTHIRYSQAWKQVNTI